LELSEGLDVVIEWKPGVEVVVDELIANAYLYSRRGRKKNSRGEGSRGIVSVNCRLLAQIYRTGTEHHPSRVREINS
jgi:hypothetical protein